MSKPPLDPVTEKPYMYGVSYDNKYYEIGATLETLTAKVVGNYKGLIKRDDILYNPKGIIFVGTPGVDQDLRTLTYYVTDESTNLPYKLNADTTLTGGTAQISTGILINDIKRDWNATLSGTISEDLGVPLDTIGSMVFGEKEYFANVKEKGSTGNAGNGIQTPSTPAFPTTCGSGQSITYEQAQNNKASILQDENINNYIGCNITGIGKIAGFTYSGSTWESKETMVLVVETTDTAGSGTTKWGTGTTYNNITAGTNTTTMTGSIYAWDGLKNTTSIIALQGTGTTYAAQKCHNKGAGVRYLPATEELNQLYCYSNTALTTHTYYGTGTSHADCVTKGYSSTHIGALSNFSAPYYWSSTEYSADRSRFQVFDYGGRYSTSKFNDTFAVRCVSRF